jgi:EAL domain-containing protein (putative c-di-GMP-specific phosphodiesterase class I)
MSQQVRGSGHPIAIDSVWYLTGCTEANGVMRRIPVNTRPFQVGRQPHLSLYLPSRNVSKLHAEIIGTDAAFCVRDLGSTNGTYLNGRRIKHESLITDGDLVQFADMEFRVGCVDSTAGDQTMVVSSIGNSWLLSQFDRLINDHCLVPFFQPIFAFATRKTCAYEVLARSNLKGLENPGEMFSAATRLQLEVPLSTICRVKGVLAGKQLPGAPNIFMNTHPAEDLRTQILESLQELRKIVPYQPMTLEIHEKAVTDLAAMKEFIVALRALNIGLAYDDFGAGQSRLLDLVEVPPDYLKFDISLIRNIHTMLAKQQMVDGLLRIVRDFGIAALAEGIECAEEALVCEQLGFAFAQGFFFGHPAPLEAYLASR